MPASFVINSIGDAGDSDPTDQIAWTGNMILFGNQMVKEVTLRAAIEQANALASTAASPHLISVAVAEADVIGQPPPTMVVALTAPLPDIHQFVVIDGTDRDFFKVTRNATANDFTFFRVGTQLGAQDCSLTLTNMTIRDALATNGPMTEGGAVKSGRRLVLDSVTFTNNQANKGGAVFSSGTLIATNCSFIDNKAVGAGADGGAINIAAGTATLTTCRFEGNTAAGGKGGALSFNAITELAMLNTDFINNAGDQGGAIYSSVAGGGAKLSISGGNFDGNTATGIGGALQLSTTDAVFDSVGFRNNSARKGGAIYSKGNRLTIEDCTFEANNTATLLGPLVAYDGLLGQSVFITLLGTNAGITANDLIRDPG